MTQVTNLLTLAPKLQDDILAGRAASTERNLRAVVKHVVWEEQEPVLRVGKAAR